MTRPALSTWILFVLLTGACAAQQAWNGLNPAAGSFSLPPGGDVLRPGGPSLPWYLGIDGGITYSSFYNGPVILAPLKNPYNSSPAAQRSAMADAGNGIGVYFGAAVDVSLSKSIGLMGKLAYNTRKGEFSSRSREAFSLLPPDTTDLVQNTTWNFRYISLDVLLRFQLMEKSLYVLVGPSFNFLSGNTVKLEEQVLNPNAFYVEEDGTMTHQLKTLSSETDISNVEKTRVELKAGLGWWIRLDKKLFLTPEVLFGFPLTHLLSSVRDPNTGLSSTPTFNHWTLYATIGFRWQM